MDGLTSADATRLLGEHGPNELPQPPADTFARRLLRQFRSPLVYILLAALAIETATWTLHGARGWPLEAVAIGVTLLLNAALGGFQEQRSEAALARLRDLSAPHAWVVRDGRAVRVPARDLVPGDKLRLEAGDRIPSDATVLDASVMVDESVLTGESLPVERAVGEDLHSGTLLVRGKTHARVTRTGSRSAMGRLAHLLAGLEMGRTPLERRLDRLGRQVSVATLVLAALLVAAALLLEGPEHLPSALLLAVALAVAVVPEELPAVLTLTLALGVERMARRKALVRRLGAVEALGSVTVIATDKTGTLTENRIRVERVEAPDETLALRVMALANDADPASGAGDPLDLAFLDHAASRGLDVAVLRGSSPRVSETPFDSAWKYMRATVREEKTLQSYLKGAPEAVLSRCHLTPEEADGWRVRAGEAAARGHRVLALAVRDGEGDDGLAFCGLVSMWDPPRPEVRETLRQAGQAGVRVVMVTGDHPETARAVAERVGFPSPPVVMTGAELDALPPAERAEAARRVHVFARVSPQHKVDLVEALQAGGEVVAMTGDGVNDAPALKRADVGIAMGQRGSDVAREAASIVLLDDDFATIVSAIEEGRSLYENIQKFIRFMFSTSLGFLLLVVGGAAGSLALGLRDEAGALLLPLTALQILWINFLADGPPAFALGLDRNPGVLDRPPRAPSSPLLDAPSLRFIATSACVKAGVGLLMLLTLPLLGYGVLQTQAAVFAYEFLAQLAFADPARRFGVAPLPNRVLRWTLLAGFAVQIALFALPPLREALGLALLDATLASLTGAALLLSGLVAYGLAAWARRAPTAPREASA